MSKNRLATGYLAVTVFVLALAFTTLSLTKSPSGALVADITNEGFSVTITDVPNSPITSITGLNSGSFGIEAGASSTASGVNITINKTEDWDPANVSEMINYSILINNTGGSTAFNITLTEIYPADVLFVNGTPTPTGTSNESFLIGNLSGADAYRINISVIIKNDSRRVINNTVNLSYFNASGTNINLSVTENTSVDNNTLTRCLGTITANVTLRNDLLANFSDETCITFGASSIVLDCAGYALRGFVPTAPPGARVGTGTGVLMSSVSGVLLRRCEITNFRNGVNMTLVSGSTLSNNTIHNNSEWGTRMVLGLSTDLINDSQYYNNSVGGIYTFLNVGNISIANNNITNNTIFGVYFNNTHHSTIAFNNITNHQIGVLIRLTSPSNVVYNNTFQYQRQAVQLTDDADSNIVRNNTIANSSLAINVTSSSTNNNVYGNWVWNSSIAHANTDDSSNEFDLNVTGEAIGNWWDDISSLDINDSNSNVYGDTGTEYPYKLSNGAFVLNAVQDDGPILNITTSTPEPESSPAPSGGGGGGGSCTDACKIGENICGAEGRYVCAKTGVCTTYVLSPCASGEVCSKGSCVACPESWVCDAWGPCVGGTQERSCFDTAGCGTTRSAPITKKACELLPVIELPSPIVPLTYGEMFAGTPVTCAVGSDGAPAASLSATTSARDLSAAVPRGYTAVSSPFSLTCNGEDLDVTLAVSDKFTDYRVLKCTAEDCADVTIDATSHLAVPCGTSTIGAETEKKATLKETIFLPKEVSVFPSEFTTVSGSSITKGPYSLSIEGIASARLSESSDPLPTPANPSLVVLGNALVVEVQNADGPLPATVTMPSRLSDTIDRGTVGVFVLDGTSWRALDSTLQESGVVTAKTNDLLALAKEGHAIFAVLGSTCNPCEGTAFNKAYGYPGARTAVIFVHGAFSDAQTFNFMIEDLKANRPPYDAWTFEYPTTKSVDELANSLTEALLTHAAQYDEIDVVGHSAGGLIAQQAVWSAYTKGQDVRKIKKLILIGTPSGGSPAVQTVDRMFNWVINQRTVAKLFNINSELVQASVTGKDVPRVPGIDYQVIAGTRPYGFNLDLFTDPSGKIIKNDGLITISSAQKVGAERINNSCSNFYELNLTHTDLIDNELGIRVTERIIASDSSPDVQARSGYAAYITVPITTCRADDQYLVVGKELRPEKRYDPSGCACGNGWCGDGEDALSCPGDCADVFTLEALCVTSSFLVIILTIAAVSLACMYVTRRWLRRKEMRLKWLYIGEAFVLFGLALVLLLSGVCAERPWFWVLLLTGTGAALFVLLLLERKKQVVLPKFPIPRMKPAAPVKPAQAPLKALPIDIPPVSIPKLDRVAQRKQMWPWIDAEHHPEQPHIDAHERVASADSALDALRKKFAREPKPVSGGRLGATHKEVRDELDELNKELASLRRRLRK